MNPGSESGRVSNFGMAWFLLCLALFAVVMLLNGMGHTIATIFGQTVSSVRFPRPAPGFYSSPLLFAGSIYLLIRLRASRRSQTAAP